MAGERKTPRARARASAPTRTRTPAPTRTRKAIDWMGDRIIPGLGVAALVMVGGFIMFTYRDVAPRAEVISMDQAVAKISALSDDRQDREYEDVQQTIKRIVNIQDSQIVLDCNRREIGKDPDFDDYCRAYFQSKARGE